MADLNDIYHLTPVPTLVLDPDFVIAKASRSFYQRLKLHVEEACGQDILDFLIHEDIYTDQSSARDLQAAIEVAIADQEIKETPPRETETAGKWSSRITPIFKEQSLVYTVIEWQHIPEKPVNAEKARAALLTDEAFKILVQSVKDYAIFLLDTNGCVMTWNPGAEMHKQYKQQEILGKHFSIFYGREDLKNKKPQIELEICMRDGRVEDEGWRYRKDGSRFWANVVITAVYNENVHVGFSKVTRDLTERKAAESRLIAAYEESAKLKSDFLANMSHEIRTPVHGMLSANSLLLDTGLSADQKDLTNIIEESGKVLVQVINDILDYTKLASGTVSLNSDVVGIASIITLVTRSEQTLLQPGVHFELSLDSRLPRSAQGDPLRYRQIIQNLISNAAKFTQKGFICVKATLESEDERNYVILTEVIDTGIGISAQAAKKLFTPFTQIDDTGNKRYRGTGLGLSIAKTLTELMGGQISFRPNPESPGSIFYFTSKFKKIRRLSQVKAANGKAISPANRAPPELPVHPLDALKAAASGKRLLLAEDNDINQRVMFRLLKALNFDLEKIDTAVDGANAIRLVLGDDAPIPKPIPETVTNAKAPIDPNFTNPSYTKATTPNDTTAAVKEYFSITPKYDLILMDINMPLVDGYMATAQIRSHGVNTPIVAMTAYALKGAKEACLDKQMNDYISKPVNRDTLLRVLHRWLIAENIGK